MFRGQQRTTEAQYISPSRFLLRCGGLPQPGKSRQIPGMGRAVQRFSEGKSFRHRLRRSAPVCDRRSRGHRDAGSRGQRDTGNRSQLDVGSRRERGAEVDGSVAQT